MNSSMQFGDYIWPNNPGKLEITYHREVKVEPRGNNPWNVLNTGRVGRVFEGEGEFFGTEAYTAFGALAQKFNLGAIAVLTVPGVDPANALLTDLVLLEQDAENYLQYRFKFVETP